MNIEKKDINLIKNDGTIINSKIFLYDQAFDDEDLVLIEIEVEGEKKSFENENFFMSLVDLRKDLENKNIQIQCNGAAKNVYPSPMQLSMGTGRKAYIQDIGKQATLRDVVDIFDCNDELKFVTIEEQLSFHNDWIESIMGK